jgi:hypothetical protein
MASLDYSRIDERKKIMRSIYQSYGLVKKKNFPKPFSISQEELEEKKKEFLEKGGTITDLKEEKVDNRISCPNCGAKQTIPAGSCSICQVCGETTGCS